MERVSLFPELLNDTCRVFETVFCLLHLLYLISWYWFVIAFELKRDMHVHFANCVMQKFKVINSTWTLDYKCCFFSIFLGSISKY